MLFLFENTSAVIFTFVKQASFFLQAIRNALQESQTTTEATGSVGDGNEDQVGPDYDYDGTTGIEIQEVQGGCERQDKQDEDSSSVCIYKPAQCSFLLKRF